MRRSTWLLPLASGNAVLLLAVSGCAGGGKSTPTPSQTSQAPVVGATAPDGGALRVTEQGLSRIKDGSGKAMVSFGVIVKNTSRNWVANGTKLTITLTDAAGAPVEDQVEHGRYGAYATFPQRRTGLGAQVYVGAPDATRIQVRVGPSTWVPQTNPLLAEITATDAQTRHGTGTTMFGFALASAYHRTVDGRYVDIIFRDQDGRLIGGAGLDLTRTCGPVPPGRSTCSTGTIYPLPTGTVDSRTAVYVSGD